VLGGLQIRTYRNGILQETATSAGLLSATLLSSGGGKYMLSFVTSNDFDEVQLFASSTIGLLSSIRVYHAYEGPASCPTECIDAISTDYGATVNSGNSGGLVCLGAGISNPGNVVDGDTTNNASITSLLGLGCTQFIEVTSNTVFAGGTETGFVIEDGGGLLDLSLLGGITISTYLGATPRESFNGSGLLSLSLLGGTGVGAVGAKTNLSFDRVRISVNSGIGLLGDLDVYYAYIQEDADNDGTPDCLDDCAGDNTVDSDGDGYPDDCDTNTTDLAMSKSVDNSTPAIGDVVTYTITVTNESGLNTTGLQIQDTIPAGMTYQSHTAPTGTFYDPLTGIWNVGSALGGSTTSLDLSIMLQVDSFGSIVNFAEVVAIGETDLDSSPGNGDETEDDFAFVCISVPLNLCSGETATLTGPAGLPSYQWYLDGNPIPGATNQTYEVTAGGSYTLNSSTPGGCPSTVCCPIVVTYFAAPTVSIGPDQDICGGETASLTASASGAGTFLWSTGETTPSINVSPFDTMTYSVTFTDANGCTASDTINVNVAPAIGSAGIIAICNSNGTPGDPSDDTFTFTLNPTGGSGTTYSITGDVVQSGLSFGSASNPFGPYLISGGNLSITITDDATSCTLAVTVTAPSTCSACPPTPVCLPVTVTKN
ncbi:MAG: hypothetical protein R2879_21780, partial [Saprospiraceae bacterium]